MIDRATYFLILPLLFSFNSFSQGKEDFARSLYSENDYFRGISIYKELLFFSDELSEKQRYTYEIAKGYYFSEKNKLSVSHLSDLLNMSLKDTSILFQANRLMSLNYLSMNNKSISKSYIEKQLESDQSGKSNLIKGLISIEEFKWQLASEQFRLAAEKDIRNSIKLNGVLLSEKVLDGQMLDYRREWVSVLFSAIIPGSGQMYCDHFFDGIQSFGMIVFFSVATYVAYSYDRSEGHGYALTSVMGGATGLFYYANLLGASKTAGFYNQRQREMFVSQFRYPVIELSL